MTDIVEKKPFVALEKKMSTRGLFLPFVMGPVFKKMSQVLGGSKNSVVDGMPYSLYYDMDQDPDKMINCSMLKMMFLKFNFVLGIPVKKNFDDSVLKKLPGFKKVDRPGGRYVSHLLKGPYSGLGKAHIKNLEYVKKNNLKFAGETAEIYLNDPRSVDKSEIKTEVLTRVQ